MAVSASHRTRTPLAVRRDTTVSFADPALLSRRASPLEGVDARLAREPLPARPLVGRRGRELRTLLRERHGSGAVSLRSAGRRARERAHPAHRARRLRVARLPARRPAGAALRIPGARSVGAGAGTSL